MAWSKDMPDWLMGLVRCPNSKTKLMLASPCVLRFVKERMERGDLCTKLGRTISAVPTQGLVSEDLGWFYPMIDGIPCLLPDEAILLPPGCPNPSATQGPGS